MTGQLSVLRDIVSGVNAEVDREPIEESVRKWRVAGRHYAKQSQELFDVIAEDALDGDDRTRALVDVSTLASLATMYLTLAGDANTFGKLPAEGDAVVE